MGLIYKIIWNDYEIGEISDLSVDMWYIEGKWTPFHTYKSVEFEKELKSSDPKLLLEKPEKGQRVVLQNIAEPSGKIYCLALFLDGNSLSLRQIVSQEAIDMFF